MDRPNSRTSSAVLVLLVTLGCTAPPPSPTRIVAPGGGGWKDGQVNEPCVLVNPKDPTRLLMFFSGMQLGGSRGAIGKAWARVDEPLTWHEDAANPILTADPAIPFEASAIRLDGVVYVPEQDQYWLYSTGHADAPAADAIGLATCPAGDDGYTAVTAGAMRRFAGNPILAPGGQGRTDETCVSQGAVVRTDAGWYSLYSYRTATQVLPGIRLATSTDGRQWTKVAGPDLLAAAPEQQYIEWHQVCRLDDRWLLLFEGYDGGTRWRAGVATSTDLAAGWIKATAPLVEQTAWRGYRDDLLFHVATPAVYRLGDAWWLFFQAARAGPYWRQPWSLFGVRCDGAIAAVRARRDPRR